jgi:hypothetical protein
MTMPKFNNPLSRDYRPPEPKPPSPTEELIGDVIEGGARVIGWLIVGLFSLAGLSVALSVAYGVVLLIFRHAYGVELPNPFNWFG